MALIGNNSVVNKSFARFYCGIGGNTRANSTNLSYNKSRQLFFPFKSSLGQGYNFGDTDIGPISPGGLASINIVEGLASITASALRVKASAGATTGSATVDGSLSVLTQAAGSVTGSATVSGAIAAVSALSASATGSATVDGSLKSNVPLAGSITGSASPSANLKGIGSLSGEIDVAETAGLTANAVATAVWSEIIESGYTAEELLKILASVAAGKTNVVDNGGGSATVTFRDLADTKDRVEADMIGSERSTVTLDVT